MIILGLNGLLHDASVCLIKDGVLLSAVEHERVSRFKGALFIFPFETVNVVLQDAGYTIQDIDVVAWNFDYRKYHVRGLLSYFTSVRSLSDIFYNTRHYFISFFYKIYQHFYIQALIKGLFMGVNCPKIIYTPHYLAHFLYAYHMSPFKDCAALIVDGGGEYDSTILMNFKNGKEKILWRQGMPGDSLGILYSIGTYYLGYKPNSDEYKVMGLASYGKPNPLFNQFFKQLVKLKSNGHYEINKRWITFSRDMLFNFSSEALDILKPGFAEPNNPMKKNGPNQAHMDFAYELQKCLEETVIHILKYLKKKTQQEHLILTGGVFLNATLNGLIKRSGLFRHVFIPPAPHDAGTAIGAAIYAEKIENKLPATTYLGLKYSDDEIEQALKRSLLDYTVYDNEESLLDDVVDRLCEQKIIAWFQGRMEFGPRALGNRSIIADPRKVAMRDKLNRAIKAREDFRPFAPSVIEEQMPFIFMHETKAPYMITTDIVKQDLGFELEAVTHVDGTARPQSVHADENPLYYKLIKKFYERTGVPVLLNTSFNYNNEPIVHCPQDAIRCFYSTGIDVLIMNRFCVQKSK